MLILDFVCSNGHRHERFVQNHITCLACETCGLTAERAPSAPRINLEGCTGDFPGAHMRWEQKRAQKQAIQARKERDHGDTGW